MAGRTVKARAPDAGKGGGNRMHAVAVRTTVAEYDLLDPRAPASAIQACFQKPEVSWDASALEPGEVEAIQRATVRGAATQTIDIIREDRAVWVTYSVTMDFDFNPNALNYFGVSIEDIIVRGCRVSFPIDENIVDLVEEKTTTRVT